MVKKGSVVILITIAVVALIGLGIVMTGSKESGPRVYSAGVSSVTGAISFGADQTSPSDECELTCRHTCIIVGLGPPNRFVRTFEEKASRADCEAVSTSGDFSAAEELCSILIGERARAGQRTCGPIQDVNGNVFDTELSIDRDQTTQAYCECDPPSVVSSPGPAATPCPQRTPCPGATPSPIVCSTDSECQAQGFGCCSPTGTCTNDCPTPTPAPTSTPKPCEPENECIDIDDCDDDGGIIVLNRGGCASGTLCCSRAENDCRDVDGVFGDGACIPEGTCTPVPPKQLLDGRCPALLECCDCGQFGEACTVGTQCCSGTCSEFGGICTGG